MQIINHSATATATVADTNAQRIRGYDVTPQQIPKLIDAASSAINRDVDKADIITEEDFPRASTEDARVVLSSITQW